MTVRSLEFLIPGDLATATGGYGYDRRIVAGLRELGWRVTVHHLDSSFPIPSVFAMEHAHATLAQLPTQSQVLIDGLAAGAMPSALHTHATRLQLLGLIHHPLNLESGLSYTCRQQLAHSETRALEAMRHIVVTSAATRRTLAAYGVHPERISVVEPGTDPAPLARRQYAQPLNMLCVATLTPRKGHDLLFQALAAMLDVRWQLTCVGSRDRSPPTTQRLREQLRQLNLEPRVRLVGEVGAATLSQLYSQADVFVLPTRYEGYGMAVAEALAHGLPIISTAVGAIPELVGTRAGLLVAPDDLDALREALSRVLRQPQLLSQFAAGALEVRKGLPSWSTASAALARVLELQDPPDGRRM